MLTEINKRLANVRANTDVAQQFIERAKMYAAARTGKIIALKVPTGYVRAQVEAVREEHGFKTYTEAVHFIFAMGLITLKGGE